MKTGLLKLAVLSFSFLAILASCNKIQTPVAVFQRAGNSLVLANNDNVVIAGYNLTTSGGYDASLMMINTSANSDSVVWGYTFGGAYSDAFYSVKKANNGGFIAAGFSNKASATAPAMYVVITDANGKMITTKTYGGSAFSQGLNVISDSDTSYMVSGYMQKSLTSDRNLYLVKINNGGDTIWTRNYGTRSVDPYDSVNDAAYGVIKSPDGGYFLTGNMNAYNNGGGRIFLMKVSAQGDSLWTKTFSHGMGYSLTLTHENGIATGIAISGSLQEGSSQDIFLLKTDLDGNLLWKQTFGGSGYEYGSTMIETTEGGFAITGISDSKGNGLQDACLILTNSQGIGSWDQAKTYGQGDNEQGFGLIEMPDKGFCITGLSNSGGSYIFVNRTSSDGTQIWAKYIE